MRADDKTGTYGCASETRCFERSIEAKKTYANKHTPKESESRNQDLAEVRETDELLEPTFNVVLRLI